MRHVDGFETTDLPERLGRELAAGAPCVAVMVADDGDDTGEPSVGDGGDDAGRPARRASATVYRVGDGYVIERDDASGVAETVGMRSDQLEAYLAGVRHDDAWTVLSITEQGAGGGRERIGSESTPRR